MSILNPKFHFDVQQRTPEWYALRDGVITGTKAKSILGKITLAKTQDAINNLAMRLAIESVYGMIESDYVDFDMQRGIDMEPRAFELLQDKLAQDFIQLDKVGFVSLGDHLGTSPDGVAIGEAGVEIKCPTAENFFKYVLSGIVKPEYYTQMQHGMLCMGYDKFYFHNYCVHLGKEYTHTMIVKRDEEMIKLISERADMVINLKLKHIEKLKAEADDQSIRMYVKKGGEAE